MPSLLETQFPIAQLSLESPIPWRAREKLNAGKIGLSSKVSSVNSNK